MCLQRWYAEESKKSKVFAAATLLGTTNTVFALSKLFEPIQMKNYLFFFNVTISHLQHLIAIK